MPTIKHLARTGLQRLGIDVQRFPDSDPAYQTVRLLQHHGVDLVLDVGANDGGYARSLRRHGYQGRIHSFEPLPDAFEVLAARVATDRAWTCQQLALGSKTDVMTLNVAGNDGASSSLLPMLDRHREAAPDASYVDACAVRVERLDDVLGDLGLRTSRTYLKLDVQGYEGEVLSGARGVMASPSFVGLQLELSLVPLYEGGILWRDAVDLATGFGLTLQGLQPGFSDSRTGQLLQADGLFFRAQS